MSHPWTGPQQIGRVKRPQPATATDGGSWWMCDAAQFYREARERFPEAGAAISDRGRVYTRGAEFVRPSKQRGSL
jgi:hypothetical protein